MSEAAEDIRLPHIAGCRFLRPLEDHGATRSWVASYLGTTLVVVKIYDDALWGDDPEGLLRYEWECEALMGLTHPALPVMVRFGHHATRRWRYLVQEYIFGSSLRHLHHELGRPLTPGEAAEILLPIADALVHCHARGLPHGRLTPWHISLQDNDPVPQPRLLGIRPLLGWEPWSGTKDTIDLARIAYGLTAPAEAPPSEVVLDGRADVDLGGDAAWNELVEMGFNSASPETSMADFRDALEDLLDTDPRCHRESRSLTSELLLITPSAANKPAVGDPELEPHRAWPRFKRNLLRLFK